MKWEGRSKNMTASTFTTGPWSYIDEREGTPNAFRISSAKGSDAVAYVVGYRDPEGNDEETEANARLVGAAPDLLAACEKVLNYLEDGTPTDERSDAENFAIVQLVDAIRKAGGTLPSEYTRALGALAE